MFEDRASNVIRLADYRAGKLTEQQQLRVSASRLRRAAEGYDDVTLGRLRRLADRYDSRADELAGLTQGSVSPALLTRAVGGDPAR
jgi:hypothetical protein